MMEFGEGVCKLRKMNFENGPFLQFEKEISAVLNFIYQTQLEVAACEFSFNSSFRFLQIIGDNTTNSIQLTSLQVIIHIYIYTQM